MKSKLKISSLLILVAVLAGCGKPVDSSKVVGSWRQFPSGKNTIVISSDQPGRVLVEHKDSLGGRHRYIGEVAGDDVVFDGFKATIIKNGHLLFANVEYTK